MKKMIMTGLILSLLIMDTSAGTYVAEANEEQSRPQGGTGTVAFTDDLGRQITVENPERVAALLGSFADLWYLAGGEVIASADDAWDDFELPLPEDAVNLGMTKELSLEKLFESDPDLVLASANTKQNVEWMEILDAAGITAAYFDVSDFEDYLRVLKLFTEITGRPDLYEKNGSAIQKQIQEVVDESLKHIEEAGTSPSVLVLRASATILKAKGSRDNVLGEMLAVLGCENIADSETSLLENLSLEHIMMEDPDFIFICQHGDDEEGLRACMDQFILEHPAWNGLTAVKEGRVYYMEKELFSFKPNDRWAEAYEKAEEILFHE